MKIKRINKADTSVSCRRPLFMSRVAAGFPSPAEDFVEGSLDLNEYLVRHPAATFFVRVTGDSMIGAGIHPEDLLIVDRSLEPTDRRVVIAVLNGELTVKRLRRQGDRIFLEAENDRYKPIEVTEANDFSVWGVVTSVIHPL
ncbi:LexA family protein [Desulfoluna butyratoxydans]|uniref:Peptidase s24/s26a/s26b/s26c n=1 Tax=Desulfoluna butyratoxydans TaxID=231438 RepID=A0A4U8YH12_9BACT|nr:translesion error-prone DNA polymerase V autoproteolytic subunit [Desulfoluna butyratoxydans]VFQ42424.1 peptidase s24/s26a/s26b/s26c [Desulfoluna butyratoxydans]